MMNHEFISSQLELKKKIEERTGAILRFEPRFSEYEQYCAWLVWENKTIDEDGDICEGFIELSFLADHPQRSFMTEEQILAYPPELQSLFRCLYPDETCNALPAVAIAETKEDAVKQILLMTRLLDNGWHLGNEEDFADPFIPQPDKEDFVPDEFIAEMYAYYPIKFVTVYCGSNNREDPDFEESAADLGKFIAAHNMTLVYGGSNVGTMKILANSVLENGGKVIGIFPQNLAKRYLHPGLTETLIIPTLAERKAEMIKRADVIVALPGGVGTWDELFDALALQKLGSHHCPIGILNINGYFDHLIAFIQHSVAVGFTASRFATRLKVGNTPEELFEKFYASIDRGK